MAFPVDFSGEIGFGSILSSNVESFQRTFMERARERFERVHADVEIYSGEISFRISASRLPIFSVYPSLLACSGKIILNTEEGTTTYYVNFIDNIIILSVAFWAIFGSFFVFVVHGPFLGRVVTVILVWLIMVVASSLVGIRKFKLFIGGILSEMHVSQL